jgi:hypothetical protein
VNSTADLARFQIERAVLAAMATSGEPSELTPRLEAESRFHVAATIPNADALLAVLGAAEANDPMRAEFHSRLKHWDFAGGEPWTEGTDHNTRERRLVIYRRLGLSDGFRSWCDTNLPMWEEPSQLFVIDEPDQRPWYEPNDPSATHFYWDAYSQYLRENNQWPDDNIEVLNERARRVIEHLADPRAVEPRQTKGLVVGFVQSGKTANFTGVLAKAADAGYRLFIILAGTLDLLRNQTQRRIDKELIGRELVEQEYVDDDEWTTFLSHGARPSQLGSFDWERLTGRTVDYQSLGQGIAALDFQPANPNLPYNHPENLRRAPARILIIKKQRDILEKVTEDLRRVAERIPLNQVPTVVIDDESDQASLNTRKPTNREHKDRTAINLRVVELLRKLPRAQYIGYTATPFANFFVDPLDVWDLFPRDFIIPLPRPDGYMGMTDFHDLGDDELEGYQSNERTYVRAVVGVDKADGNLPTALDAFVLSGAVKLWRSSRLGHKHRHHTMLIHSATQKRQHEKLAQLVEELWLDAGYEGGKAMARLRRLWETDFLPIMRVRATPEEVPQTFDELRTFIGECLTRINSGRSRILVVNSDNQEDNPDFERQAVWKILVGGAKLSRGYTIEGLTISYYRRRAQTADTLTQMGRWFGFRRGYSDLVRLFIGRQEPLGKGGGTIDLYAAFEGACRDELALREEFKKYASGPEGGSGLRPIDVPPLVASHMLRPTSANKMYDVEIQFQNFGEDYLERTLAPDDDIRMRANEDAMRALLKEANPELITLDGEHDGVDVGYESRVCVVDRDSMWAFLSTFRWQDDRPILARVVDYLNRPANDTRVYRWVLIAPQDTRSPAAPWMAGPIRFAARHRSRTEPGGRYGVYSESKHRYIAKAIAGVEPDTVLGPASSPYALSPGQAVMLFYPVRDESEAAAFTTMGFALQFPKSRMSVQIRFGVRSTALATPGQGIA